MEEKDIYGNTTGGFTGKRISAEKIEGLWTKPDGSKSVPFVAELKKEKPMDEQSLFGASEEDESPA